MNLKYKILVIFLGLILLVTASSILATQQFAHSSASIAQSKAVGRFIQVYDCEPKIFKFKNHYVIVQECWLEKPKEGKIPQFVLTLMFDGNYYAELRMRQQTKDGIVFKHTDKNFNFFELSRCCPLISVSEIWMELLSQKAYHRYAHFINLKEPFPDKFKLEVCSQKEDDELKTSIPLEMKVKDEGVLLILSKREAKKN